MTTRPTIRWRDLVAHLDGEVVAARAVSVECAFSIIATGGAAARGCQPTRRRPSIRSPSTGGQRPLICRPAAITYLLHNQNQLFLLLRDTAAADIPVVIAPRDQIELVRVLPDYTSCQ
jgi:hypothetical protein